MTSRRVGKGALAPCPPSRGMLWNGGHASLLHRNARRIEHEVPDSIRLEQPVQPKAVIARLIAARYRRDRSELPGCPGSDLPDQRQQPAVIAPRQLMPRNPVPLRAMQRHQPCLLTEFDRNENCATMAGGGRDYGRCLHPTSPMARVYKTQTYGLATLTAPWNLQALSLPQPRTPRCPARPAPACPGGRRWRSLRGG